MTPLNGRGGGIGAGRPAAFMSLRLGSGQTARKRSNPPCLPGFESSGLKVTTPRGRQRCMFVLKHNEGRLRLCSGAVPWSSAHHKPGDQMVRMKPQNEGLKSLVRSLLPQRAAANWMLEHREIKHPSLPHARAADERKPSLELP